MFFAFLFPRISGFITTAISFNILASHWFIVIFAFSNSIILTIYNPDPFNKNRYSCTPTMRTNDEQRPGASGKVNDQSKTIETAGDLALVPDSLKTSSGECQVGPAGKEHDDEGHGSTKHDFIPDGKTEQNLDSEPNLNKGVSKPQSRVENGDQEPLGDTHALEPIPRSRRRGLFGRLTVIPEVVNPYSYPNGTKWIMTIIASLAGATSSTGSSIFYRESSVRKCNISSSWAEPVWQLPWARWPLV